MKKLIALSAVFATLTLTSCKEKAADADTTATTTTDTIQESVEAPIATDSVTAETTTVATDTVKQ